LGKLEALPLTGVRRRAGQGFSRFVPAVRSSSQQEWAAEGEFTARGLAVGEGLWFTKINDLPLLPQERVVNIKRQFSLWRRNDE